MPTDQGNGREAAEDVAAVGQAAEELGMKVVFVTTDGDHDTDEAHRVAHSKYASAYLSLVKQRHVEPRGTTKKKRKPVKDKRTAPAQSLDKIMRLLISQDAVIPWPLSDLLHLLKNMRQQIRDSDGAGIAWRAEAPTLSRGQLFETTHADGWPCGCDERFGRDQRDGPGTCTVLRPGRTARGGEVHSAVGNAADGSPVRQHAAHGPWRVWSCSRWRSPRSRR
jgi:hypothetical protein